MSAEHHFFIQSEKKWFCHVDDDNYVNIVALVKLLRRYPHYEDWYLGKPSFDRPVNAHTENVSFILLFLFVISDGVRDRFQLILTFTK